MIELAIKAVIYAAIRAKHDSYLREGKWKLWSFIEGIFVSGIVAYDLHGLSLSTGLGMALFGMIFWVAFDSFTGILFGKNPLYIGNTGFDKKVRGVFNYTDRFKGTNYLIFKMVWLLITYGLYKNFAL